MQAWEAVESSPFWHVQALGNFQLRSANGEEIARLPTQKTARLLAYLACNPQRKHGREVLIHLLWPDADISAGRLSLRVALNALRRRLEPPSLLPGSVIYADASVVALQCGSVMTDAVEFEQRIRSAQRFHFHSAQSEEAEAANQAAANGLLEEAVALYRGELLPGFYDEWVLTKRAYLANQFCEAQSALAHSYEAQGRQEDALWAAQRLIEADALREEGHLLLMRLYAGVGRRTDALRQYQELKSALQQKLQTEPSPLARDFYEQIRAGKVLAPPFAPSASRPIPVYSPAPSASPVPSPPSSGYSRLPASLTRFWGRADEIKRIRALLKDSHIRLITLTGIGGIGKTRLSTEVARNVSVSYTVLCFVALADVYDPCRIYDAIAAALNLPRNQDVPAQEQVVTFLEQTRTLLVLDNFEHLVETGREVIQDLLQRLPNLTLMLTTRQRLELSAEHAFAVPPFTLPLPGSIAPAEALTYDAVALFVSRAQVASPAFQITLRNADAIVALCRKLEGIPLAIELAASWSGTLTPAQILNRLDKRFELLISRRHDVPARHQTLRAVVEWSCSRLKAEDRRFFVQLSIFRGGWTLEAAEAVCEEPNAVSYLRTLQEQALLVTEESQDGWRYRMLETLREFAQEQLDIAEQSTLAERHARWCLQQLKQRNFAIEEQENYRSALRWVEAQPEAKELYFCLIIALFPFWRGKGWWREALACTEAALARADTAPQILQGRLHQCVGVLNWLLNDTDKSKLHHEQALDIFVSIGDKFLITNALNSLGAVALRGSEPDLKLARHYYLQSLEIAVQLEDDGMILTLYGNLGYVAMEQQDWKGAQMYFQDCLMLCRKINQSEAWALQNLAALARTQANWTQARALYEQSLAAYRLLDETYRIAEVLDGLALALEHCGDAEAAAQCREESRVLSLQLRGD